MKNNRSTINKDFDYFPLALILWREKFLILILTFFGFCFSYFSVLDNNVFEKATVTIKSPPKNLFLTVSDPSLIKFVNELELEDRLYRSLLSRDNLINFLGDEKKLNVFKFEEYKEVPGQTKSNKFEATYINNIDGPKLLTSYILYTQSNIIKTEVEYLNILISHTIDQYKNEFEIAERLGIKTPVESMEMENREENDLNVFFAFRGPTYLRGTIILGMRIASLEEELKRIEKKNFLYDIILDKPYVTETVNNYTTAYLVAGAIFGFLVSLIIIFIKSLIKEIKKYSKI